MPLVSMRQLLDHAAEAMQKMVAAFAEFGQAQFQ